MPLRPLLALAALAAACASPARMQAPTLRVASARPPAGASAQRPAAAAERRTASAPAGSPAVTIAVVDTGVAPVAALVPNLTAGTDLVDGRTTPSDGNGHGTAMASIAAARAAVGVCGLCTVMPVRVVGSGGIGTDALAAAGVRWADAHGARVVNVSLTSRSDAPELTAAIEDAAAHGVVVVTAAGNEGEPTADAPGAGAPDAVVVAGVDQAGDLYPWSNHGAGVDVAAPGRLTALNPSGDSFAATGTSVAAAYVSGVVGLMLSANPALSPARVEAILRTSGRPVAGLDVASGRVVDAQAAVAAALLG